MRGEAHATQPRHMPNNKKTKPFHHGAKRITFDRAKDLRHRKTSAEALLWKMLRDRALKNAKFRRQHPIGPFITDFYCHEAKLVIELDGSVHDLPAVKEKDAQRQRYLEDRGLTVLRFSNDALFTEVEMVIDTIEAHL